MVGHRVNEIEVTALAFDRMAASFVRSQSAPDDGLGQLRIDA
jgi:hypothetical protein